MVVDAQASDSRTEVGGWLPCLDEWRNAVPRKSCCVSLDVRPEDIPRGFVRDRKPAQTISTLEALAVLFSLKPFRGAPTRGTATTNHLDRQQGNRSVLNKLMTARYPSSALVMELAAEMKEKPSQGAGPMDIRVVQPRGSLFSERGHESVQPRTGASCGTSHAEVARPRPSIFEMGLFAEKAHDRAKRRG